MTTKFLSKAVAGALVAGMLSLPGCLPQALAADPTDGMISTAIELREEYDLPAGLLLSVAEVESDFNPYCKTGKCHGLMQIHSSYAKEYAALAGLDSYDLFDYRDSMRIAAAMLDGYIDKYDSLSYALVCYNLGEYGAQKNGSRETWYSRKVMGKMEKWADVEAEHAETKQETEDTPKPDAITAFVTGIHEWFREVLFA